MVHPLDEFEIQGTSIKCFDENGSGFFHFSPVSVVIGKNNAGKSTVIDLLDICIARKGRPFASASQMRNNEAAAIDIKIKLKEFLLQQQFSNGRSGGYIQGNHWSYGKTLIDEPIVWRYTNEGEPTLHSAEALGHSVDKLVSEIRQRLARCNHWSLDDCSILRVAAERSVSPESSAAPAPQPNGKGITNLIRYFINSDSRPRDVVEIELLKDLNRIYAGDSEFTSIICQENDQNGTWEIFLREEGKGDIRLSESGSSLQSVFIILSYFRLVPLLDNIQWTKLILAVEEPENNLHPALLRRLITFLARKRHELGFSLILTTHSPVCIDWATKQDDAGIIHVTREAARSVCRNVMDYDGHTNILDDLDVRGSDILQSNGIIWVEGPSDRVYLRCWLDIMSGGKLIEGSHYTFMYYGGKVLSHFEALPEAELSDQISMVTLNRNVAIVMDSDRKWKEGQKRNPQLRLNTTKRRLISEVEARGGFSWVTKGKEVENYIPQPVWEILVKGKLNLAHEFENIPDIPSVKAVKSTKVALAHEVVKVFKAENFNGNLDLAERVSELMMHIRRWNSLDG